MPKYRVTVQDWPFTTVVEAANEQEAELKAFDEYENKNREDFEPEYEVEILQGRYKPVKRE